MHKKIEALELVIEKMETQTSETSTIHEQDIAILSDRVEEVEAEIEIEAEFESAPTAEAGVIPEPLIIKVAEEEMSTSPDNEAAAEPEEGDVATEPEQEQEEKE